MKTDIKNLHGLVSLAASGLIKSAVQRSSFIVNEVPLEFQIATDEKLVSAIINSLLTIVVSNSAHSCIKIKANEYDDIISVSIKDNSSLTNYTNMNNIEEIQLLAKTLNGNISIRKLENKFTTILLSFPNFPKAA